MTTPSANSPQRGRRQFSDSIQTMIFARTLALAALPLLIVGMFLVALVSESVTVSNPLLWGVGAIVLALLMVAALSYAAAASITAPLRDMADTAARIAEGQWQERVADEATKRNDEIGQLANAFNHIGARAQATFNELEQEAATQTQAMEAVHGQLKQRTFEQETATRINQRIGPLLDVGRLNQEVVNLLQERFNFYYIALFLTNPSGNEAMLSQTAGELTIDQTYKAASSTVGGRSLLNIDRLIIDGQTLIGQAATTREIRLQPVPEWVNQHQRARLMSGPTKVLLVPQALSEIALPLLSGESLVGILDIQITSPHGFDESTVTTLQALSTQIAIAIERAQLFAQSVAERDRTALLYEINTALSAATDLPTVLESTLHFAERFGAEQGEIHIQLETGQIVSRSLRAEPVAGVAEALVSMADLPMETLHEAVLRRLMAAGVNVQAVMAAPILVGQDEMNGVVWFGHQQNHRFGQSDRLVLEAVAAQVGAVLQHSLLWQDIEASLRETHLMLSLSQQMVAAPTNEEIYRLLVEAVLSTGANRCTLHLCEGNGVEAVQSSNVALEMPPRTHDGPTHYPFEQYPLWGRAGSGEMITIADVTAEGPLNGRERALLKTHGAQSVLFIPLVARQAVLGFVVVEYQQRQALHERGLTLFRTLCNQATVGIENARQAGRTEVALAESQTLYRAGRILAKATQLQEMLEDALVEFLYSLNVEQGGIVLLTPDRKQGYLGAYVEGGLPQTVEPELMRFEIVEGIGYQEILLAGQPFVSEQAQQDPRIATFKSFNPHSPRPYSVMLAPLILQGETVGWLGADSVQRPRHFLESEVDLSRAMADQIAIAMMNRRLLEQTQRQAEQLQAVAQVGEAISEMLDLGDILSHAVELIKTQLALYHVSIFVVDEAQEWAVVRASTGEVGQIMVERPHQLRVGGNSIVGFVTGHGQPRIALDVGADKVHFKNPLLPETRSELALPLVSHGGRVIGALDVQSRLANAFSGADVEILQIMANQLTAAIEKANLFEQTQQRLEEQATLYRIGQRLGETLDLTEGMTHVATETALALQATLCRVSVVVRELVAERGAESTAPHSASHQEIQVVGEYRRDGSTIPPEVGVTYPLVQQLYMAQAQATEEAVMAVGPWGGQTGGSRVVVSLVVQPIMVREGVVAFITVADENPRRHYHPQGIALLSNIALAVGTALENSRLYQQAEANERFLRGILNQIPDPIFIKDKERRLVIVNQAYAEGLVGQGEGALLGQADDTWWPEEVAMRQHQQDIKLFDDGGVAELEAQWQPEQGGGRRLFIRKTGLYLGGDSGKPDYLLGVAHDITDQRAREAEREELMASTAQTLRRTEALYRVSHALDTASSLSTPLEAVFDTVVRAYVGLLELAEGSVWQVDREGIQLNCWALVGVEGVSSESLAEIPLQQSRLFEQVAKDKGAVVIEAVGHAPLMMPLGAAAWGHATGQSMVVLPLLWRQQVQGVVLGVSDKARTFSEAEIEVGQTMVGQLARWLENAELLREAAYRSGRLQTAAEVSQAASQLLDVAELREASVYLIQERFDFYYVGLFMVEGEYAVLRAGTGEAGERQLERGHQLKLGGGSMIGWSVEHKSARIALDVGAEAVHFKNPDLPLTRSEMALPLISRGEVLGALTIQSSEARAFSAEDITLLQTMADQLANGIKNAQLFEQTQAALSETERLYQISQELLSAEDEAVIYRLSIHAMAQSGADMCALLQPVGPRWRARAAWSVRGDNPFDEDREVATMLAGLLPTGGEALVVDTARPLAEGALPLGLAGVILIPLEAGNRLVGALMVGYFGAKEIGRGPLRFFHTLGQQVVVALENMRLLEASQKRARREEVIRHITSKIRAATTVEEILQATASELSQFAGSPYGVITLGEDKP